MFHFTPQHSTHFHPYGYPVQPTYSSFHDLDLDDDLPSSFSPFSLGAVDPRHRHQLEQELQAREQELNIRREIQCRRQEAQKAAVRKQILARLEQRERRAQHHALMREQERQAALEHELRRRRKMIARHQEEEAHHRRQAEARRQQLAEQEDQVDNSLNPVFRSFLPLLFGPRFQLQPDSHPTETNSSPSTQQVDSTPAEDTIAEPLPSSDTAAPTPAPAVGESTPTTEAPAAPSTTEQLHQHYRTHLHRRQALSTLSSLGDSLSAQQAAFTLPSTLTFQPSPPSSTTDDQFTSAPVLAAPKLAFQSSNAPFLAYEDFLVSLLSKIDAVSSGGDKSVKQARKALVKKVEGELKRLDEERERAWEKERAKDGAETEGVRGEFDLGSLFN
ncbi:hypothetical protein BCR35DRAFT_6930 [Leucosporidium creatinivorum]|uniref:BAG domain-containing protein n=1 Tax=Leucosporidium creatinivorum TaxID=106004 RepID=A0A1Y2G457_9BASI|nr:hypothetical protein BCR35DRAFT_6930 [Leucosporidium creatinivorum]